MQRRAKEGITNHAAWLPPAYRAPLFPTWAQVFCVGCGMTATEYERGNMKKPWTQAEDARLLAVELEWMVSVPSEPSLSARLLAEFGDERTVGACLTRLLVLRKRRWAVYSELR